LPRTTFGRSDASNNLTFIYPVKDKTMKHLKIFTLILAIAVLASCKKADEQATGIGDAVIVAKKSGTNTVYGLSLYAYTFSTFKSVQAVSSLAPEKTFNLNSFQSYKSNFYYETPDASYTTTPPAAATYNFSATFENGVLDTFQDELSTKVLALPVIDTCLYYSSRHALRLTWGKVTDAFSYSINILDGEKIVFGSVELSNKVQSFAISANGGGWLSGFTPVSGKTYTVRMNAFLFEEQNDAYNVQAISVKDTTAVWGN